MDRLNTAMNRLFDGAPTRGTQVAWNPAVDVSEDKEKIVLTADLPGLQEKDVDIQIEKDVLTLRGERAIERSTDSEHYRRFERVAGAFVRAFTLPPTVDTEKVAAALKDGVLTLTLPKKPEAQPKKISVKVQ
jgi:HSP20 family protein